MAPPRGAGHRGYKKYGDGSDKVASGAPSSSDAPPRDVPETSSFDAGDGSSGDENDDLNQAGGGGDGSPSNNGSEGSDEDDIEEVSEEESGTDDEIVNPEVDDLKAKCIMLENELEKAGKMAQAFLLTMQQGFHRGGGQLGAGSGSQDVELPEDRLELAKLIDQMKMISTWASLKKNAMIDNMSEVMIYVLNVEKRETKFFYLSKSDTVKKMKISAMKTWNIPKSHVDRFIFKFDFGHRLGHREFSFNKDEALPRELNRMRVSNVFTDTASIQMSLGLSGGAKNKTIAKTNLKKKSREIAVKEFAQKLKELPENQLTPFRALAEAEMNKFYDQCSTDPMLAFKNAFEAMPYEDLRDAYEKSNSASGGDVEAKLKRMSQYMFGQGLKQAIDIGKVCEGLREGAELTVCLGQSNSDKPLSLQSIRDELKTARDKKLGAQEAKASNQMDDDL